MKKTVKYISKKKLLKLLKDKGHTEIELTYHKSEGWWLSTNLFDDWISSCSVGAFRVINNLEMNENYLFKNTLS